MDFFVGFSDPVSELFGSWLSELSPATVFVRILISLLLSAVIGCERSGKRHAAGLRTFMLVSLASTVSMLLDLFLIRTAEIKFCLISAMTVVGIAIITVNSILTSARSQIKGLTTSVGVWTCGIIGLTIGAGFYTVTLIAFAALIMSLAVFPSFERYLKNRSNHFEVHLELKDIHCLQNFVITIRELGMTIDDIESNPAYLNSGLSVYSVAITVNSPELKKYKSHKEIIEALSTIDYILHIEEMQ